MSRILVGLVALAAAGVSGAQSITFTAETTTGVGQVTPVLTWSTSPAADSCDASGDWSGAKGAQGSETLAPITSSATYNLECSWGDDEVSLTWTPPTTNTDGSSLNDLASYDIYYGNSAPYENVEIVSDPNASSAVISSLASGNWCFVVTATNQLGVESEFSNESCVLVSDTEQTESVGITVNAQPSPPMDVLAQ